MKIVKDYVKINPYTRPARKNYGVKGIVMHYTATPKATAKNERDYFNGTCIALKRYASAHYFVDKTEVRQIIPDNEIAYHAHDRSKCYIDKLSPNANFTALGVEMCIEADGSLHPDTVKRAVELVTYLCNKYGLSTSDIYRHYDVTEKNCPAMWVANPNSFTGFKNDVYKVINGGTVTAPTTPVQPSGFIAYNPIKKVRTKTDIWTQEQPNFSEDRRVKLLPKNTNWKCYGINGNYYSLGTQYVHKAYVELVGCEIPTGIIKYGDRGENVESLQECLNAANFKLKGKVDGIFGSDTLQALERFQKVYTPYMVDGIYGSKTEAALREVLD
ncbi:N-acetylmuramoyl-L-alanine amidase [Priestia endophytica]|uniref:peptidoglycan recognition protein family protein n=1 Tax=Priestia endophytica TaxID=135735 RepID=UPI003D2B8980